MSSLFRPDRVRPLLAALAGLFLAAATVALFLLRAPLPPEPVAERGPTPLEWEVIREYKGIETMTKDHPPTEEVDGILERLRAYTEDHPDNAFIHQTYAKGLRVARYYSSDAGRRYRLERQFLDYVRTWEHMDPVALELMHYHVSRIQADCNDRLADTRALERLYERLRDHWQAQLAYLKGLSRAASRACSFQTAEEVYDWTDRLIRVAREHTDDGLGWPYVRRGLDRRFWFEVGREDLEAARAALEDVPALIEEHPAEFAGAAANWLLVLEKRHRAAGELEAADAAAAELRTLGQRHPDDTAVQRAVGVLVGSG